MAKTIQEQITDMELRNDHLENFHKLFEKMVKLEFGIDAKKIHKILKNSDEYTNDFSDKIADYFNLNSDEDFEEFLSVFCTENSLNYFNKKRYNENYPTC